MGARAQSSNCDSSADPIDVSDLGLGDLYELSDGAYDEGATLHLSSGLVLQKAPDLVVRPAWVTDTRELFPLGGADVMCLNREGIVVLIVIPSALNG